MPNWCSNSIVISGEGDAFNKLKMRLEEIIVNPETPIMNTLLFDKPQDTDTWYDDNLKNLGTKWDFSANGDVDIDIRENNIDIIVSTAWSPPTNFLINLCEKYGVEASMIYSEGGNDFAGKIEVNDDGTYDDDCCGYYEGLYKYNDNFWEEVQQDAEWNHDSFTEEEYMERFSFLTEESEIQDIKDLYHKAKEDAEKF